MTRWVLVFVGMCTLTACNKKSDGTAGASTTPPKAPPGSCDLRKSGNPYEVCMEYTGSAWTAKEVESRCVAPAKYIAGPCPTDGVIFSCKTNKGQGVEGISRYYDTLERVQKACASVGGEAL